VPNPSFKPTVFGRPVLSGMKTFDSVAQRRRLNFALGDADLNSLSSAVLTSRYTRGRNPTQTVGCGALHNWRTQSVVGERGRFTRGRNPTQNVGCGALFMRPDINVFGPLAHTPPTDAEGRSPGSPSTQGLVLTQEAGVRLGCACYPRAHASLLGKGQNHAAMPNPSFKPTVFGRPVLSGKRH
jgi:hypothetical protein